MGRSGSKQRSGKTETGMYIQTGGDVVTAVGRISFLLDLQGPAVCYDTGCSSSLVALEAALNALETDQCKVAVVAGVSEQYNSDSFVNLSKGGMLSATGRCHA